MAKKMLIFSVAYFPFVGGAEVAIQEITKRLPNVQAVLLTARFRNDLPPEETIGNVTVIRLGNGSRWDKYLYPWRAARRAYQLHTLSSFDLAWAMMANYAGLAAWLFHQRSKVPYLLTEQSGDSDSFIWKRVWFWLPIYRSMHKQATRIQVISQSLARRVRSFGAKQNVAVIPNGVDLGAFTPATDSSERKLVRSDLGLDENDWVIITTSRLVYKNAISDLIKAVNDARFKLGIPASLIIVGDGPERRSLERLVQTRGISPYVRFIGHVEHRDMIPYLRAADVFCRPSLTEGLGNSFLEAMATGIPIIATPVGGIVDFLRDGETGLVCQVGKPMTIALAIQRYHNETGLYETIKTNGLNLVRERYSWDTITQQMEQEFLNCSK